MASTWQQLIIWSVLIDLTRLLRLGAMAGREISLLVSLPFLLVPSLKVSLFDIIHTGKKLINIDIGGRNHLADASTILFCISFILVIAVYVIYWKGPMLRKRSPFHSSFLMHVPSWMRVVAPYQGCPQARGPILLCDHSRILEFGKTWGVGRIVSLSISLPPQGRTTLLHLPPLPKWPDRLQTRG